MSSSSLCVIESSKRGDAGDHVVLILCDGVFNGGMYEEHPEGEAAVRIAEQSLKANPLEPVQPEAQTNTGPPCHEVRGQQAENARDCLR